MKDKIGHRRDCLEFARGGMYFLLFVVEGLAPGTITLGSFRPYYGGGIGRIGFELGFEFMFPLMRLRPLVIGPDGIVLVMLALRIVLFFEVFVVF